MMITAMPPLHQLRALPATLPLDNDEEVDDYLSFVNRTVRNLLRAQATQNV